MAASTGNIIQTDAARILCIADVRGSLRSLNTLAKKTRADYIIHTGDFGFYDNTSLDRIAEKTLKHVSQYSPLISETVKKAIQAGVHGSIKSQFPASDLPLSELPLLLSGEVTLDVPVYAVWGACEDVQVLEKFRSSEYVVPNLHIVDEAKSMLLEVSGVKLRLLGLGGAIVMHKLFDGGEGRSTIAGGQGTMWTTLLQMGELIDTATRVHDPTETRVFISHASPAREGLLNQLAVALKADFSISAGLHFRYGSSYNEFSVNPSLDHYRGKLAASKASFNDVWETVKSDVEPVLEKHPAQRILLRNALQIIDRMPSTAAGGNPFGGLSNATGGAHGDGSSSAATTPSSLDQRGQVDESAFKNMWNYNLADAAFGWLVLEIEKGRIGTEMRAQGFNFSQRTSKQPLADLAASGANTPTAPPAATTVHSTTNASSSPAVAAKPVPPTSAAPTSHSPGQGTVLENGKADANPAATTQDTSAAGQPSDADSGLVPSTSSSVASTTAASASAAAPGKPSSQEIVGLFVTNITSDEQTRGLFAREDQEKILGVDRRGETNRVVQFRTTEERDGAFERLAEEYKVRGSGRERKPLVRIFQHREMKPRHSSGNWGRGSGPGGSGPSGATGLPSPLSGNAHSGGAGNAGPGNAGPGNGASATGPGNGGAGSGAPTNTNSNANTNHGSTVPGSAHSPVHGPGNGPVQGNGTARGFGSVMGGASDSEGGSGGGGGSGRRAIRGRGGSRGDRGRGRGRTQGPREGGQPSSDA